MAGTAVPDAVGSHAAVQMNEWLSPFPEELGLAPCCGHHRVPLLYVQSIEGIIKARELGVASIAL